MKILLLLFLLCAPLWLAAQTPDSTVIKKVDSLIQVSRVFTGKSDFVQALEVNAEAEKIALEKLGRVSAAYGGCCHNHGRVLAIQGDYENAEKWYVEAIDIRSRAPGIGNSHPDYALSLNSLANMYYAIGDYEKAKPLYLEIKAIREKVSGKKTPDYAGCIVNLGNLYMSMGKYELAESLYFEAKEIFELGLNNREHPFYINSLHCLGNLYLETGQYEKAELFLLEAKSRRENVSGKENYDYAMNLSALANLYTDMGNYEKAEPLYLAALIILEKVLGKENPAYASTLDNLATLYTEMGNYEKAAVLMREAKDIREKTLGKEHPDYANSLNNLATLFEAMGKTDEIESLNLEAKDIREKVLGKEHPDFAQSLLNLAYWYAKTGQYEKAELLFSQSITILEKALGKEHSIYAQSLGYLAYLYYVMGKYDEAEPLFLQAKAIWEKTQNKEQPYYSFDMYCLANIYRYTGSYKKAEFLLTELANLNQFQVTRAVHHLSERELNNYLHVFSERQAQILSFAQTISGAKSQITKVCYDNILFYKGFLLNATVRLKRIALHDSITNEKFNLLKSYKRRLANEYAQPMIDRDSSNVASLEIKANTLEKELARSIAGYAETTRQVKWQEVQSALKPEEAAIEFVHFQVDTSQKFGNTMYIALLLLPGKEQPTFIPLFEEKSLDSLLQTQGERRADYVNTLYALAGRGAKPINKSQKSLYELLWLPMEKELAGAKTIYYSPSGLLHRLNLAAIPIGLDSVLGDRYNLVELGSTRQLVVPGQIKPAANDAILLGGISYDSDSTVIAGGSAESDTISIASTRGELSFSYSDSTLRAGTWGSLPFTDREVTSVERILKTAGFQSETRRGYAATEESFKAIGTMGKPSPRILHLATHGFFFPDPKDTLNRSPFRGLGGEAEPVFKLSDHPMIRSGLILAGANHAWATGKPLKPGMEDGILTAYEISQMNLSNTELVVLSACETGLGDIQGNEGVYGLQRAFKIAGAKYLIMSLWQVPDKQTSLLMTTFYKKWLEEKMAIPEAFRAAQKELREAGLDPYYWAGFVLVE